MTSAARARTRAAGAAVAAAAVAASCATWKPAAVASPASPPRTYAAAFASMPPPMGGSLERGAWAAAPWTEDFLDIEGPAKPRPAYRTRAKMLWDDRFLYVGAELEEPDIWSTLSRHDEVVFHDNDFEVFVDPNGDGREYYEIEINARGTVFDLFLHRPYREGAPAIHEWDVAGAFSRAISFDGTPDDARDIDGSWTVTMAIPWSAFVPPSDPRIDALPSGQRDFGERARGGAPPRPGDCWRVNFSRVQWRHNHERLDAAGRRQGPIPPEQRSGPSGTPAPYAKRPGLAEDNWVWSPQWAVDMHLPSFWGRVTFVR